MRISTEGRKNGLQVFRILLIIIGLAGMLDTLLVLLGSNLNLGVLLPMILGAPLFLVGVFLPRLQGFFASGFGNAVKWVLIGGYALAFLGFTVTSIVISAHTDGDAGGADAMIVLGAGLHGEEPTHVLRNRLDVAIEYLDANPNATAILSGGKGDSERISEAEAMARYLRAADVEDARFLCEDRSSSTQENFAFSYAIIKERIGADAKIAFVTTDFHVFRAGLVAKKMGIDARGVAADDVWYIALNNYLRECAAVWAYLILGKI